jgi:hypothetical protein
LAPATAGTTGTSTFRVLMGKESSFLSRTSGNKLVISWPVLMNKIVYHELKSFLKYIRATRYWEPALSVS